MKSPRPDDPEVYRITGAQRPRSDEQSQRITRYLISMGVRTACVVLALLPQPWPTRLIFMIGAVVLPYVAVIMANAGGDRREAAPPTMRRVQNRPQLPPAESLPPTGRG